MASVDEKQGHGRVLEFDKVTKSFAKTDSNEITHALAEVNLTIQPGEFVSIVGTSGCGKSTILRLIAGLIRPTTGEIRLGGKPIVGAGPDRGMVFQKATLFPWLTVEKNLEFGLKIKRLPKEVIHERVEQIIKLVSENGFGQIFITDTNRKYLDEILLAMNHDYALFRVERGEVQPMEE